MKQKNVRMWTVYILRWLIGVSFLNLGLGLLSRQPATAALALILGLLIIPITEQLILKQLKLKLGQWQKLGVAAVLFFLFGSSMPKPPAVPEDALPSPSIMVSSSPEAQASDEAQISSPSAERFMVASVTDGDTFKVRIGEQTETVRVVGIDTPEAVDPRQPVQCFGKEASDRAKTLLIGKEVRLEQDAAQQDRDRYGRLLRFVFFEDGTDFGLQMIREGYAQESLYSDTPHKYYGAYVEAQVQAKAEKVGLWADDVCPPSE
jgi:micrococcal nuclease